MKRVIICLSLLGAACWAPPQPAPPAPSSNKVTVSYQGDKVITTKRDERGNLITIITQPTRPDNYPTDLPAYPEVTGSKYLTSGSHLAAEWQTAHAPRLVSNYFERELAAQGWSASHTTRADGITEFKADKGGRQVEIKILPEAAGSRVALSYNAPT